MPTFGTNTRQRVPMLQKRMKKRFSVCVMPTFGTNTRQRVPVVQKMMKTDMMMKLAFWSSFNTKLST